MKLLLTIFISMTITLSGLCAAPVWEDVNAPAAVATEHVEAEGIDIAVKEGYLYVTASSTVEIRVFSILGQLISKAELHAGTSRIKLPAKGIYILKIGTTTRRITI